MVTRLAGWTLGFGLGFAVGMAAAQETRAIDVTLQGGKVAGSSETIRIDQGTRIALRFQSDEQGELHLHGYDVVIPLRAGETSAIALDATVTGRFPITSHGFEGGADATGHHRALLYLEVYPR